MGWDDRRSLQCLNDQIALRAENAARLDALLREVEGIEPLTTPPQITLHARNLYVFKHRAEAFGGLPKPRFTERAGVKIACHHKGLL